MKAIWKRLVRWLAAAEIEELKHKLAEAHVQALLAETEADGRSRTEARKLRMLMEKEQTPIGEAHKATLKIKEGLGGLSEENPSWQAVRLFIEWQRRYAHVEAAAPFAHDREAWLALGRERGIEDLQARLLALWVESRKGGN